MNQKHPIDDLFRSKLVDYELPVRDDLKQVFLNKTTPKKKRMIPFWILAIAASFIAALSFFWIGQKGSELGGEQVLSSNETKAQPKSTELVNEIPESTIEAPELQVIQKKSSNVPKKAVAKEQKIVKQKALPLKSATGLEIMDELVPDELTLALMDSQKPKENNLSKENKRQTELFKKDVGETIIIIASEFQKEEEILIPEINSDSPVTMVAATAIANARNEENNTLLAKVFTNIKHLKRGEKLDLSLTAQNDSPEDTFIGNETSEIKEKIDWIKSRISKR